MTNRGRRYLIIKSSLVLLLFFSTFFLIHISINGLFGYDDPYYHTKHSWLIEQTGKLDLIRPWIEFHFLSYAPTDPWWGYHLILAMLIYFFGPFLGTKILASLLASLVFFNFYIILSKFEINPVRNFKGSLDQAKGKLSGGQTAVELQKAISNGVKSPFIWTFLFFSSSLLFQFRLLLERPFVLAITVLPLSFLLMVKRKYLWLFILSLVYALFYNLAPLIVLTAAIYVLAEYYLTRELNLKLFIAASSGILAGILIHPQSLNYLYVMFIHLWQVLYLKFSGIELSIGSELQPISFFDFLRGVFLALLFFVTAVVLFVSTRNKRQAKSKIATNFLFLISFFWFLVSLFVPRGVDYWLPFAWLFIALVFDNFFKSEEFETFKSFIKSKVNVKVLSFFVCSFLFILVANNFSKIIFGIYERNNNDQDYYFSQANNWLKSNTAVNSLIFYNDWSYWPLMFFYNDHNHYVAGMDPTFLYEYDHNLFWVWRNISVNGVYCDQPTMCNNFSPREEIDLVKRAVKEKFRSGYILVDNDLKLPLVKVLNNRRRDFIKVYENEILLIYRLVR